MFKNAVESNCSFDSDESACVFSQTIVDSFNCLLDYFNLELH